MWRSIFIALGLMAVIIGLESMFIESASFYSAGGTRASSFMNPMGDPSGGLRSWQPQDWFPWTVLSAGMIVIIYAFTLPKRFANAGGE